MKIFSIKRLLGMAALYGAVRYVKAQGGVQPAIDSLKGKLQGLVGNRADGADGAGRVPDDLSQRSFASENSSTGRGSSYASYDVDVEDKLRH